MNTADVIAFFGTKAAAARALNCSRLAIYQWGESVPFMRQFELEIKTAGALKSDYTLARSAGTPSDRPTRKRANAQ